MQVVEVLAALADPMRWRVLDFLATEPSSASALSRVLPISRAAVLKHLAVLERTDLVRRDRVGREVRFSVRSEQLTSTARWMSETADSWDMRLGAHKRLAETTYSGIVLAGGSARRLSGVDKPALRVGGVSLLRRAVDALRGGEPVVVVGPERDGYPGVVWTREAERGAGPVAALAAGLAALGPDAGAVVVVLAADLIGVRRSTVDRLAASVRGDGAVLLDAEGKRQWLLGAWRVEALRSALPAETSGASLRRTLGGLSITEVPELPGESADIDTQEDLDRFS
jgi:molybdopterin-guanine dinucleotide biosynthesis protein A/DNA-binding MarR family transcriptional regulator